MCYTKSISEEVRLKNLFEENSNIFKFIVIDKKDQALANRKSTVPINQPLDM